MTDKRGYRECIRVIIYKSDKVLLGKKIINGKFICYEFPGGGIEKDDSPDSAIVRECLEEVGCFVTDHESLGIKFQYEVNYKDPERAKKYRGGIDNWYCAKFHSTDTKLLNSENDQLPFEWIDVGTAILKIKSGPKSEYNPSRIKALEATAQVMKKNKAVSFDKKIFSRW